MGEGWPSNTESATGGAAADAAELLAGTNPALKQAAHPRLSALEIAAASASEVLVALAGSPRSPPQQPKTHRRSQVVQPDGPPPIQFQQPR